MAGPLQLGREEMRDEEVDMAHGQTGSRRCVRNTVLRRNWVFGTDERLLSQLVKPTKEYGELWNYSLDVSGLANHTLQIRSQGLPVLMFCEGCSCMGERCGEVQGHRSCWPTEGLGLYHDSSMGF
jgi:hypothetical protein